jgi:hypothetical protein
MEFVLLVGRRSGPVEPDELRGLWPAGGAWPGLPGETVLRLLPARVSVDQKARGLGRAVRQANPEGQVRERLEALRRALLGRCDYFEGLAFRHQARQAASGKKGRRLRLSGRSARPRFEDIGAFSRP